VENGTNVPRMTAREFRAALVILGGDGKPLPEREAARILYHSVRTIRNWRAGRAPIPPLAAEKLIRLVRIARNGKNWRKFAHL